MDQFFNNNNQFSGETTDFGIPLDIENIEVRNSDEFEASSQQITRSLEIDSLPTNGAELEFQPSFGSNFAAASSLFAVQKQSSAPVLPFYYKPCRTHYRSSLSLAILCNEVEEALSECNVEYTINEQQCIYTCSMNNMEFVVRIFSSMSSFLVEFQQVDGCRWAFSQLTSSFAKVAEIAWGANGSVKVAAPFAPLLLDDLAMPQLVSCSA
jgi:hypothetical protein